MCAPPLSAGAIIATSDVAQEEYVVKTVKQLIVERRQRESRTLEDTLQVVFLGPADVGKCTLVNRLLAKYPLSKPVLGTDSTTAPDGHVDDAPQDVYGNGSDFGPNARIAGSDVRLSVLRRGTLTSRRMLLGDVGVLRPDILVMCCSAHVGPTYAEMLVWDKVLRANITVPRVWALLTHPDFDSGLPLSSSSPSAGSIPPLDSSLNIPAAISSIYPASFRPRAHYVVSTGEGFSIGLRSLSSQIVLYGRGARDDALATAVAQAEAISVAEREAARRGSSASAAASRAGALNPSLDARPRPVSAGLVGPTTPVFDRSHSENTRPMSLGASANAFLGAHQAGMPRISLRAARESARDVNASISNFVSWISGP
jgi:hypothetical protein